MTVNVEALAALLLLELLTAVGFLTLRVLRRAPSFAERLPVELSLVAAAMAAVLATAGQALAR